MNLREAAEELGTRIWRTAGARFHAWRRQKNRNWLSAFTIALLSVYLIGIAVYQKIYDVGGISAELDNRFTLITIVGAVFIIVLSLIEWAGDFSVNAKELFDNATELKALQSRVSNALIEGMGNDVLMAEFREVSGRYTALTDKHSTNHEPVDDFLFRAQNKSEPSAGFHMNGGNRVWARVWWFGYSYGFYVAVLILPLAAIILAM